MTVNKYNSAKGIRWRVRYVTPNGKQSSKRGFKTKKEAELWEAQNRLSIEQGTYVNTSARKVRVAHLLDDVLKSPGALAPSSLANRESTARTWVAPYWDERLLFEVNAWEVNRWVDWMREQGAGETTVEKAFRLLGKAMQVAVDRNLLQSSPMPKLALKRRPKRRQQFLTLEQVNLLRAEIEPRSQVLVTLLALSGLRFGEAAALQVRHLRFDENRIDIDQSVTEVKGHLIVGPPKNGSSRSVPMPLLLREDLQGMVQGRRPDDIVFPAPNGGHIRLTTWRSRVFYVAVDALVERGRATGAKPFPRLSPHDLRHTAASLAVQAGANVKVLQRMLGHASAAMTLDVYSDLYDSDLDELMARMDAIYRAETNLRGNEPRG